MKRPLFYLWLLLLTCVSAGGCTTFSPRPANTFRTVFGIHIGSADDTPEQFEAKLDDLTDSRAIPGNCTVLLQNGDETYPEMIAAIESARSRISMTTYDLRCDQTGRRFAEALRSALRRGVEVRLVYDEIGSDHYEQDLCTPLVSEGLQLRTFNPKRAWTFLRFNNRSHRKILVIDGRTAFLGGLNIGDNYAGDGIHGWRDMALRVDGPAAAEAEKVFAQGWNQAGTDWLGKNPPLVGLHWLKRGLELPLLRLMHREFIPPAFAPAEGSAGLPGKTRIRVVEQSPEWVDSHILNLYLLAINSAKEKVYIYTPYFIPPAILHRALIRAARRGVDVRVLTQDQTDERTVLQISRYNFKELVENGVKLYGWEHSILHAKAIVIDDRWCSIGSCNLDGRALFLNYEANLATDDGQISAKLSQQFLKDIAVSRQYTLEECRKMIDIGRFLWAPLRGQF